MSKAITPPGTHGAPLPRYEELLLEGMGSRLLQENQWALAQILEQGLPELRSSRLNQRLKKADRGLAEILRSLSPELREKIDRRYGEDFLEGWIALSQEKNPDRFQAQLLSQGKESVSEGQETLALVIFDFLSKQDSALAEKAVEEADAVLGKGSRFNRLEYHLGASPRNLVQWGLFGGIFAGNFFYKGLRHKTLKYFFPSPGISRVGNKIVPHLAAAGLGFAAEVPAFGLTHKAIDEFMHGPQDWSHLSEEGASLGTQLFFLKSFGFAFPALFYRTQGLNPVTGALTPLKGFSRTTQIALPPAAMVSGIYVGTHADAYRRGQTFGPDATTGFDSVIFGLQYYGIGKLLDRFTPKTWRETIHDLDRRALAFMEGEWKLPSWKIYNNFAWETPGGPRISENFLRTYSVGEGRSGGEKPLKFSVSRLAEKLKVDADDARLMEIIKHIEAFEEPLRSSYQSKLMQIDFLDVPSHSQGPIHRMIPGIEVFSKALFQFRHALNLDGIKTVRGSLFNHLLEAALVETVLHGTPATLEKLHWAVGATRRLQPLENFFRESGMGRKYRLGKSGELPEDHPLAKRVDALGMDEDAARLVKRYLARFEKNGNLPAFLDPAGNHIHLRGKKTVSLTPEFALRCLETVWNGWEGRDLQRSYLILSILRSQDSQVPMLYLDRFFKILATGDYSEQIIQLSKLGELAYEDEFDLKKLQGYIEKNSRGSGDLEAAADFLNGTVYTGFIHYPELARRMTSLYAELPELSPPERAAERRASFRHFAESLLQEGKTEFDRADVLKMLLHRPTSLSRLAAEAIQKGDVDFELVSPLLMRMYMRQTGISEDRDLFRAYFVVPKGRLAGESHRPLLAVMKQDPKLSREEKIRTSHELAAQLIHEFSHYLRDYRGEHRKVYESEGELLEGEMLAWFEEEYFKIHQGDMRLWNQGNQNPYGFPMHLRNSIELGYYPGPALFIPQK